MVAYEGLIEIIHHDLKKNKRGFEKSVLVGYLGKKELSRSLQHVYFFVTFSIHSNEWEIPHFTKVLSDQKLLKVIYHPLYGMNNYVLIWGDRLAEGHMIDNHPI